MHRIYFILLCYLKPNAARSKTEILVKNLPFATTEEEITEMFQKFGTLGRVILPPSGVTAIVEFVEPTEARTAFRSLAYSRVNSDTMFHFIGKGYYSFNNTFFNF